MNTFIQHIKSSFLVVSITTLTLLFTSSKDLYEKLFVDWFGACRIVIDVEYGEAEKNGKVDNAFVSVLAYGDVPKTVVAKFLGEVKLSSVTMMHSSKDNLIMHRHVGLKCPIAGNSDYCKMKKQEPHYYEEITWKITEFNRFVTPIFRVDFVEAIHDNADIALKTYIQNFSEDKACKVEAASAFNFWTWGKTWLIPIVLFLLMILFMSISKYLEGKKHNNQGGG